jgi:hypothetical protein
LRPNATAKLKIDNRFYAGTRFTTIGLKTEEHNFEVKKTSKSGDNARYENSNLIYS